MEGELRIILVEPQIPENVGAAARAMANFGLSRMRLVAPCDDWAGERAIAMAAGADAVLDSAVVFGSVGEAVADLHRTYASTARPRDVRKSVSDVRSAMRRGYACSVANQRVGVLFGRERWGLTNDEISLADEIVMINCAPSFSSFNLAQAVLLIGYEWFSASGNPGLPHRPKKMKSGESCDGDEPATGRDMSGLFDHLERELQESGFFFPREKMPLMVRKLRTVFYRSGLSRSEVSILHGVVRSLANPRSSVAIGGKGGERGHEKGAGYGAGCTGFD